MEKLVLRTVRKLFSKNNPFQYAVVVENPIMSESGSAMAKKRPNIQFWQCVRVLLDSDAEYRWNIFCE